MEMAAGGAGAPAATEAEDLEDRVFRLTQENKELREYAERTTRELRRYQTIRNAPPPARPEDDLPLPPWATNMQMMSPLLFAYEERISELEAVVERSVSLAEQTQALTRENDSLRGELKERTEQLRHAQLLAPAAEPTEAGQEELQELYRLSVEQNEALAQQNQLLKVQLERMQHSLNTGQQQARELHARALESTSVLQAKAAENETALKAEQQRAESLASQRTAAECRLEEITGELVEEVRQRERLQLQVEALQKDLQAQAHSLESCRRSLQERCKLAAEEEERLKGELGRACSHEREMRARSASMERELVQTRDQLGQARGEADATKQEAEQMMKLMESMERRLRDISERHDQVHAQLADQERQVADLLLEKDRLSTAELGARKQAERLQTRLEAEVEKVRKDMTQESAGLRSSHGKALADLEDRLRRSEQSASELQGKVELAAKQRSWEAAALERQATAHASEKERLQHDLEEEHQERLKLDRQADQAQRELASLRRDLEAAQARAREQASKAAADVAAVRTKCQAAERQVTHAKEEAQVLELRAAASDSQHSRLGSELREAREGAGEALEAERRRAQAEKQRLERQLQAVTARAQHEEQRAVELLRAQEVLRQRWHRELGLERDDLEGQVERLMAENRALREKSRSVLRTLASRRPASPSVADCGEDRLLGSIGLG